MNKYRVSISVFGSDGSKKLFSKVCLVDSPFFPFDEVTRSLFFLFASDKPFVQFNVGAV